MPGIFTLSGIFVNQLNQNPTFRSYVEPHCQPHKRGRNDSGEGICLSFIFYTFTDLCNLSQHWAICKRLHLTTKIYKKINSFYLQGIHACNTWKDSLKSPFPMVDTLALAMNWKLAQTRIGEVVSHENWIQVQENTWLN